MDTQIGGDASSRSLDVIVEVIDNDPKHMKWPIGATVLAEQDNIRLLHTIKIKWDPRQGPQDRTNLVIVEGGTRTMA